MGDTKKVSDEKSADPKLEIELPPIPEPILPPETTPELQTGNTTTGDDAPNYFEFKNVSKGFDGRPVLDHGRR